MITLNTLKALDLCASNDNSHNVLQAIYIEAYLDSKTWSMVSTDGYQLLKFDNLDQDNWDLMAEVILKEFGFKMPEKPECGYLYIDKKKRDGRPIFGPVHEPYPKYRRVIPDPDRENGERPLYTFKSMAIIQKIYKLLYINEAGYFPDSCDGEKPTAKEFKELKMLLIVMPAIEKE